MRRPPCRDPCAPTGSGTALRINLLGTPVQATIRCRLEPDAWRRSRSEPIRMCSSSAMAETCVAARVPAWVVASRRGRQLYLQVCNFAASYAGTGSCDEQHHDVGRSASSVNNAMSG